MSNAPCRYCADRQVGCHGLCKAYNDWAKEHDIQKMRERDFKSKAPVITNRSFTGTSPRPGTHRRTRTYGRT